MRTRGSSGSAAGAVAIGLLLGASVAQAAPAEESLFVSIGGGAIDSAAFRWSAALSQILSRPRGLPKCEAGTPCGIPGVIASAQTFDQPDALLAAIADGKVTTGILSATQIFDARCVSPKDKPPAAIQVLKGLYRQPLQLVVAATSPIGAAKELAGTTIAVGEHGSDSEIAGTALLDAYGPHKPKVRIVRLSRDQAIGAIKSGSAQAALFVGRSADRQIGELLKSGEAKLVALPDSPERRRMLRALPLYEPDMITPPGPGTAPSVATVSERAFWVIGPALDSAPTEQLVAAESSAPNATRLMELVEPVAPIADSEAFRHLPAPLAEGAQRYAVASHLPIDTVDCPVRVGAK